jgi:hypothetical protein
MSTPSIGNGVPDTRRPRVIPEIPALRGDSDAGAQWRASALPSARLLLPPIALEVRAGQLSNPKDYRRGPSRQALVRTSGGAQVFRQSAPVLC